MGRFGATRRAHYSQDCNKPKAHLAKKVRTLAPEAIANAHQRTCLCALMLEVYFRYLTTIPRIEPEKGG